MKYIINHNSISHIGGKYIQEEEQIRNYWIGFWLLNSSIIISLIIISLITINIQFFTKLYTPENKLFHIIIFSIILIICYLIVNIGLSTHLINKNKKIMEKKKDWWWFFWITIFIIIEGTMALLIVQDIYRKFKNP